MNITTKQLQKVKKHYEALKEYREFIQNVEFNFDVEEFKKLDTPKKAVLEAYLKRFSSLQDYLGAKVFKSLLDMAGISYSKMSEVLILIEKEDIVSLDMWIEFRNVRNDLEHDYPDELEEALSDLKYCFDSFEYMQEVVIKVFEFARRYDESISLYKK
jgi:predicted transcriptional regulator